MSDDEIKETVRANGEVVFSALKSINGPATIKNVVEYLAAVNELNPNKIRKPVKEILATGYNLGFLAKKGTKYMFEGEEVEHRRTRSKPARTSTRRSRSRSRQPPS